MSSARDFMYADFPVGRLIYLCLQPRCFLALYCDGQLPPPHVY